MDIKNYGEFWQFYLQEHAQALNRRIHFVGTSLSLLLLITAIGTHNGWWVLASLVVGYAFAWFGHFFIEKNRPATFRYPIWSFISDWRMWALMLLRRPLK